MHIQKDINMRIKYSVLRLKKCKYETPCVGYDTQVTVKACGPLVCNIILSNYVSQATNIYTPRNELRRV